MDLQSFIQSGLLESYVLGQCTRGERSLVEQMLAQYPEARAEMSAIEQTLEGYAKSQAITPPQGLKGQIMDAIERESGPRMVTSGRSNVALRAFQLLALGLLAAAVFLFFQKNKEADEKTALRKQVADIEVRLNGCDQSNQDLRSIIAVLRHPATRPVKISDTPGKAGDEKVKTYVFSNTSAEQCAVLLDMQGMPAPDSGKYFEMWAVVNGQPQPMGTINLRSLGGLQKFACIPNTTAYAVSIENMPEGTPTAKVVILSGALAEEGE